MKDNLWFLFPAVTGAVAAFFTGLGVYAWRREKPMWFWSGSTVRESEISDVPAYNKANGIMWIVFSAFFWLTAVCSLFGTRVALIFLLVGFCAGVPALAIVYERIYDKYKRNKYGR